MADVATDSEANFYLVSGNNLLGSVAITTATLGVSGNSLGFYGQASGTSVWHPLMVESGTTGTPKRLVAATTVSSIDSAFIPSGNIYVQSGANWTGVGSVFGAGGSFNAIVLGSVAITTSPIPISGNSVNLLLTTGSSLVVALPSGTITYVAPITNTRHWVVSVSGNNSYEITGISGTNMAFHTIFSGGVFAQDTTPPAKICIRVNAPTSGTVEMWAP